MLPILCLMVHVCDAAACCACNVRGYCDGCCIRGAPGGGAVELLAKWVLL